MTTIAASRATQPEHLATAPQGNVTQLSHKYAPKPNAPSPNATNTKNSGEAEEVPA
jgi:hypothetical protein